MLEDAYVLSQEPILLYNLGRAYEGAGDAQHALDAYRRYLETSADIPNADAVRATIATLEVRLEEEERAAREAAERARVEAIRREVEAQRAEREARAQAERIAEAERARVEGERQAREARAPWPWVIAGTGAATLVAGAVVGALALERGDAAAREPVQATAAGTLAEARDLATGANAAFVVGGVLALAGVAWGIVEVTGSGEREVAVEVSPTFGGVSVAGRF
jgi:tetratricopeptide (TPR) repeat protein